MTTTENNENQNSSGNNSQTSHHQNEENNEKRKYAGKYDTVEQLEEGYKNASRVYQENEDLKKKLDESSKVPDDYFTPEGIELDEASLNDLKETAKHAELSQAAFDRLAAARANKLKAQESKYQEARNAMRDEDYNVLESYVKKNYAPSLVDSTIKKLVVDKDARQSAMQHREQLLNGTVTGVGKTGGMTGYHITKDDLLKSAAKVKEARTGRQRKEAENKHITLTSQYAAQKRQSAS